MMRFFAIQHLYDARQKPAKEAAGIMTRVKTNPLQTALQSSGHKYYSHAKFSRWFMESVSTASVRVRTAPTACAFGHDQFDTPDDPQL